jgi:hypothetical protein
MSTVPAIRNLYQEIKIKFPDLSNTQYDAGFGLIHWCFDHMRYADAKASKMIVTAMKSGVLKSKLLCKEEILSGTSPRVQEP